MPRIHLSTLTSDPAARIGATFQRPTDRAFWDGSAWVPDEPTSPMPYTADPKVPIRHYLTAELPAESWPPGDYVAWLWSIDGAGKAVELLNSCPCRIAGPEPSLPTLMLTTTIDGYG